VGQPATLLALPCAVRFEPGVRPKCSGMMVQEHGRTARGASGGWSCRSLRLFGAAGAVLAHCGTPGHHTVQVPPNNGLHEAPRPQWQHTVECAPHLGVNHYYASTPLSASAAARTMLAPVQGLPSTSPTRWLEPPGDASPHTQAKLAFPRKIATRQSRKAQPHSHLIGPRCTLHSTRGPASWYPPLRGKNHPRLPLHDRTTASSPWGTHGPWVVFVGVCRERLWSLLYILDEAVSTGACEAGVRV
jgi:hypothetical protein